MDGIRQFVVGWVGRVLLSSRFLTPLWRYTRTPRSQPDHPRRLRASLVDAEDYHRFEDHLAGCATCASELEAMVSVVELMAGVSLVDTERPRDGLRAGPGSRPRTWGSRALTSFASQLAGPRYASSSATWKAHLLESDQKFRTAMAFVWAALRMRAADVSAWGGRRLDWWLTTDGRVAWVCTIVFTLAAGRLYADGGLLALAENGESLTLLTASPVGAAAMLRRIRGVEVKRKAEKA